MLKHTFIHIPEVGTYTERALWRNGITSMEKFLDSPPEYFSPARVSYMVRHIQVALKKIVTRDAQYFYNALPTWEHWRIFKEFKNSTAYIDIETTGLDSPGNIITTIALYDGKQIRYYVQGENLDDFVEDIMQYEVIVTYNGKCFDVPFIERYFGIEMPHVHLDLRYILRSLGYRGGLKSCEKQLGIGRTGSLQEIHGFFAVLLWQDYESRKDIKSLETLLSYNIEDVLSLEHLMIKAYNQKIASIPLPVEPLQDPSPPSNPFKIDVNTVIRLKKKHFSW